MSTPTKLKITVLPEEPVEHRSKLVQVFNDDGKLPVVLFVPETLDFKEASKGYKDFLLTVDEGPLFITFSDWILKEYPASSIADCKRWFFDSDRELLY